MTYSPLPDHLAQAKPFTTHTQSAQARIKDSLNFADRQDFEILAGFYREFGSHDHRTVRGPCHPRPRSNVVFGRQAPDTVNPSLWRQPN